MDKVEDKRESKNERSSWLMRLANDMLVVLFHLIQSALDEKVEAKPLGCARRERSQGRAITGGREVACLPSPMELPLGRSQERASLSLAKFDLSASFVTGRAVAYAVSDALMAPVLQAITSSTRNVRSTDEVPRRPVPLGQVSPGYKLDTKGQRNASETGTASPRPRLEGCQQRQSRGARGRLAASVCSERQNLRVPPGPLRFMGPVSPDPFRHQMARGDLLRSTGRELSNSPQQPGPGQAAVR
jgi:hypothetical protein